MLARFVERAIERLDSEDGDPDLEDATDAEDEGITWKAQLYAGLEGAGCPVSDPGGAAWTPSFVTLASTSGDSPALVPNRGGGSSAGATTMTQVQRWIVKLTTLAICFAALALIS